MPPLLFQKLRSHSKRVRRRSVRLLKRAGVLESKAFALHRTQRLSRTTQRILAQFKDASTVLILNTTDLQRFIKDAEWVTCYQDKDILTALGLVRRVLPAPIEYTLVSTASKYILKHIETYNALSHPSFVNMFTHPPVVERCIREGSIATNARGKRHHEFSQPHLLYLATHPNLYVIETFLCSVTPPDLYEEDTVTTE